MNVINRPHWLFYHFLRNYLIFFIIINWAMWKNRGILKFPSDHGPSINKKLTNKTKVKRNVDLNWRPLNLMLRCHIASVTQFAEQPLNKREVPGSNPGWGLGIFFKSQPREGKNNHLQTNKLLLILLYCLWWWRKINLNLNLNLINSMPNMSA